MKISTVKLITLIKAIVGGGGGGGGAVDDVRIDGTSVVTSGVANIPLASASDLGAIKVNGRGLNIDITEDGLIGIIPAQEANIKAGNLTFNPVTPINQHHSTFYGLAKAAGDTTQSSSSNTTGTYTETAKSKISDMLSAPETVSGSTPSIVAKSGVQYICGEVSTIDITVPESGCIDVIFESGSTPTVLTVTPPTGVTDVLWPSWFDPDNLEANSTYEISIENGKLGVVAVWG